ncbi:hypothetical protein ABPG74_007653 [Tetrahymena malaccensis]
MRYSRFKKGVNYFELVIKKYNIIDKILYFLDDKSLCRVAQTNSKFRMIIKHYYLQNYLGQFNEILKSIKGINNQFRKHLDKKLKLKCLVNQITKDQIKKVNQNEFLTQQQILLIGLQNNGHFINKHNEAIPYILQHGIKQCFLDIFEFSYPVPSKSYGMNQIPQYSKNDNLTHNVNFLIETIYDTIQLRYTYKGTYQYQKNQQNLLNYIKKSIYIKKVKNYIAKVEPLKLKKERCVYSFLNKNLLNLILSFLDIRSVLNLNLSSKKMSQLIDFACVGLVENLNLKKQELMNKLNMDEQQIEKNQILLNYFLLSQKIKYCNQEKLLSFEDTQIIINYFNDLTYIYENAQFQVNKTLIENQLNLQEKVYVGFIQSFYYNQNHISNIKFIAHYKQSSSLIQEYLTQIQDILGNKIPDYFNKILLQNRNDIILISSQTTSHNFYATKIEFAITLIRN